MRTKLITALVALGFATTATADTTPAANSPDFVDSTPARSTASNQAVSSGARRLRPMGVLLFGFDSSMIDRIDRSELEVARDWIVNHPRSFLVIEGYTDATGTYAYNAGLATRRAEGVRAALIALGAPASQLVVGVYGEALATSPNSAANRRVIVRGTDDSLATIKSRTLVDGMAVVWDYNPTTPSVAKRNARATRGLRG